MSAFPWTEEDLKKNPEDDIGKYRELLNRIVASCGENFREQYNLLALFLADRSVHRLRTGGSRCVSGDDIVLQHMRKIANKCGL